MILFFPSLDIQENPKSLYSCYIKIPVNVINYFIVLAGENDLK